MKRSLLLGVAAATLSLFAYDPADYSTWMQLKGSSGKYTDAVWYDPADEAKTPVVAESSKCYFVPAGAIASSSAGNNGADSFAGASLAISGRLTLTNYGSKHTFPELRLLPGAYLRTSANVTIEGNILIDSTAENPCEWSCGAYGDRDGWIITAPISSTAESVFKLGNNDEARARDSISGQYGILAVHYAGYVRLKGSLSGFNGNMTVTPGTHLALGTAVREIPGSVTLSTNVYFESENKTGELTIGTLNLQGGSEVLYNRTASASLIYVITKRLTIDGNPEVGFGTPRSDGSFKELSPVYPKGDYADLFRLTGEAAKEENLPDVSVIRLSSRIMRSPVLRNATCSIVDGENGDKIVRLSWTPIHRMVVANNYDAGLNAFCPQNGSYWEPEGVPDKDLVCDAVLDKSLHFREYGTVSFTNMTITANGQTICNDAYDAYIKELHIDTFSTLQSAHAGAGAEHKFRSPIIVHGTRLTLGGWGDRWNSIYGPIRGSGSLEAAYGEARGTRLAGDNSGFCGDILLSGPEVRVDTRPTFYFGLNHRNALGGGPYVGRFESGTYTNDWRSISITASPYFVVGSDLDLTEPTRGVCFCGQPTFEIVDKKTMTITENMTYSGELTKRGPGRLVLGNAAPYFSLTGTTRTVTPTEGTNGLVIAEGTLQVTRPDAVNGLAVSFGEDASLVVNVEATGDLKAFGAKNVKWMRPFTTTAESGKIPVVFEGAVPAEETELAICTISAEAFQPEFDVPTTYGKRTVTTAWRENGDGVQTLYADISGRPGLSIIIK